MKIALFGNTYKALQHELPLAKVLNKVSRLGVSVAIEEGFAAYAGEQLGVDISRFEQFSPQNFSADLAVSIGGDGTFLRTAECVADSGIPILGVNAGRLGFLADVPSDAIDEVAHDLSRGAYTIEKRSLIAVEAEGTPLGVYPYALNEVAVLKHDNSALIEICTEVDGELLNSYLADGLIVSTPTGSTGYSLSVGGPILVPQSRSFCVSAVAPHSLNNRPVVLCDDVEIRLKVASRSHNFLIAIDGRSQSLPDNTLITLRRASFELSLVKLKRKTFFDTLREKMMWGADQRI